MSTTGSDAHRASRRSALTATALALLVSMLSLALSGTASAQSGGSIGDLVFHDANGDGVFNPADGDFPLPGITVTLQLAAVEEATTVTDSNGMYQFNGLAPELWRVTIAAAPDGTVFSTPTFYTVSLGTDEAFVDADFGFAPIAPGSIGDLVFQDANGDGVFNPADGDFPLPGITVVLQFMAVEQATMETDANGMYLFAGLEPNLWRVTIDAAPAGTTFTTPTFYTLSVGAGEALLDADFGFTAPASGSIGDLVFSDTDGDGVQGAGELGLAGVLLTLTLPDGTVVATTMTVAGGFYEFDNIEPGSYVVEVGTGPTGSTLTTPATTSVDLASGDAFDAADFGFAPAPEPGSIGDLVFSDTDGDGVFEPADGDFGLSAITVTLTFSDGTTDSTTTNSAGAYEFEDLPPGNYAVTVGAGPSGSTLTTLGTDNVVLAAGEEYGDADFGFEPAPSTGSIGGLGFFDVNSDGVFDPADGDFPAAGVVVRMELPAVGTLIETTTDADGMYVFENLGVGFHSVQPLGGLAGTCCTVGGFSVVELDVAQQVVGVDFGLTPPSASIGDLVFADVDADGVFDPAAGDFPLAGVTVTLDIFGTSTSTMTDAGGSYEFDGLLSGIYQITVGSGPTGSTPTTPTTLEVRVRAGERFVDADFGFEPAPPPPLTSNVGLDKTGPATVTAGDEMTYVLTVANTGETAAGPVTLTDALPDGVTFVAAEGTGWTCTGATPISCELATLAVGESTSVEVTVEVPADIAGDTLTNMAAVTAANDSDPSNNLDEVTTTIERDDEVVDATPTSTTTDTAPRGPVFVYQAPLQLPVAPPVTPAVTPPAPSTPPPTDLPEELAFTGLENPLLAVLGFALVGTGSLVMATRRRLDANR